MRVFGCEYSSMQGPEKMIPIWFISMITSKLPQSRAEQNRAILPGVVLLSENYPHTTRVPLLFRAIQSSEIPILMILEAL